MFMLALLLFTAASQPASPASASPPAASHDLVDASAGDLDGHWIGGMRVPAGLVIPFELHIDGTGGRFAAPDQGASNIPIRVTIAPESVVVEVPSASARFEGKLSPDGSSLDGEWKQGDRVFPATFQKASGNAGSSRTSSRWQTPAAPFPYLSDNISILAGVAGIQLGATLTLPEGMKERLPAVLLLGGNGPQDRDETYAGHKPMAVIADYLTRNGIVVLRFDKRGVGGSTGDYSALTGPDLVVDAQAALSHLSRQEGVAPDRICALGLSEGATIAAELTRTGKLACVVLLSPPGLPPIDLFVQQKRDAASGAGMSADETETLASAVRQQLEALVRGADRAELVAIARNGGVTDAEANRLADEWLSPEVRTLLGNHPTEALTSYQGPALIITGALDQQVEPALNLPPIREALKDNFQAQFLQFDDLNHILQPATTGSPSEYAEINTTVDPRVLAAITDFIGSAPSQPGGPE